MAQYLLKTLQTWLIPRLRRISLMWPGKNIARDLAKTTIEIGLTKAGKPITRVMYICAECTRQGIQAFWKREDTHMDHIHSVVDTKGFNNWDEYITSLFCESNGYQCLCLKHHDEKTRNENAERSETKRINKKYSKGLILFTN